MRAYRALRKAHARRLSAESERTKKHLSGTSGCARTLIVIPYTRETTLLPERITLSTYVRSSRIRARVHRAIPSVKQRLTIVNTHKSFAERRSCCDCCYYYYPSVPIPWKWTRVYEHIRLRRDGRVRRRWEEARKIPSAVLARNAENPFVVDR